ncbi:MAG: matrixin family metalloprotease [Patescibacteria group bacterium]
MKKTLAFVLMFSSLWYLGYTLYQYSLGSCAKPLEYSIGRFDNNFGISQEYFAKRIVEAEKVWEKALNKELFIYKEGADFTINLIYDERQMNTEKKRRIEFGLSGAEETLERLDREFAILKNTYEIRSKKYEDSVSSLEQLSSVYNKEVEFWNKRDGAPEKEYAELSNMLETINSQTITLNAEAESLNNMAIELNKVLEIRNGAASSYNEIAKQYNQKYGHGLEFNQAEYTSGAINLYQFVGEKDMELALSHEFGHSLGMGHTENSSSIMYYLTEGESKGTLSSSPTKEDLDELQRVCNKK